MSRVIKVDDLSKAYQLGDFGTGTISRDLERFWARVRGKEDPFLKIGETNDRTTKGKSDIVWSLKDINFEVEQGDAVGIIGRNGAGKSTLLKVLSRVTSPTTGSVKVKGRIASLLEVGTGFHPELTGRENIYLNGAILGMRKAEIKRKFDEIVDFSGVERYVDTPVKRYSSGMYVRLAFAVAAHLESEILIIDEVLAVGDAEFQKKCLGKMGDVSKGEGRTVLFVSHNMAAITSFCQKAMLLHNGSIHTMGNDVNKIIRSYLTNFDTVTNNGTWENTDSSYSDEYFTPIKFEIINDQNNAIDHCVQNNEKIFIEITGNIKELDPAFTVGYALYNDNSDLIYWTYQSDNNENYWPKLTIGLNTLRSEFPSRTLNEGKYRIELIASLHYRKWILEPGKNNPSITLEIEGGLSDSPLWIMKRPGIMAPVIRWIKC
ncbi:ABC transporter ATP-binding protein [Mucilaginibacter sp. UYCu711]|uniref:ABC transporter ATP-binding protein n=1 Tax=Mucilaginibacter sp. UYCu711 TaxID=3156339 RepID=UPI003D239094